MKELQKNQLKVQALLQKISSLVTRYENELADLRVEYTLEVDERDAIIRELREQINDGKGVKGDVDEFVQEEEVSDDAANEVS